MAKVALIGLPIVRQKGKRGSSTPLLAVGATDRPRKDLARILAEANAELKIVDLGEVLPFSSEGATPIAESAYYELGLSTKKTIAESEADMVLAIGGNHVAALPFYHLPGNVVRADAHGDAYVLNSQFTPQAGISGGTYMFFVERQGLKKPDEVFNVGIQADMLGKQYHRGGAVGRLVSMAQLLNGNKPAGVSLLDVDADVLSRDYRLPHGHHTSDLKADDIAKLVTRLLPKIVGLFECVGFYGAIPQDIVSAYPNVFSPICKAVAAAAVTRSRANQQTPQAFSATCR